MKRYFITTFGCQMNKSDSERIAAVLEKINYKPSLNLSDANLIVVNMCSIRQSAVNRVYGLSEKFNKLKAKKKKLKTVLTGCILKKDLKQFEKRFDFILPIKTLNLWPEIIKRDKYFFRLNQRGPSFNKKFKADYLKIKTKHSLKFSVSIPISTGCDNFCTYCIVPLTRGPLICRPHKDIIKEVKSSLKNGAKEVWLLGQNVNDYKSPSDNSITFSKLLKMVNNIPGDFWLRFASSNPKDFSEEMVKSLGQCKKITPYLNLPVQSGDNTILKRMNRPYTVKQYKTLVKKIRKEIPNITLSTDIIVGFPGETKKQFQNTVKLFHDIKFDMAYIAEYSPRSGSKASFLEDSVSLKEKTKRREALTKIMTKYTLRKNKEYINKELDVLVMGEETRNKKHFYLGKSREYKTVKINFPVKKDKMKKTKLVGSLVKVKIEKVSPWGLEGKIK